MPRKLGDTGDFSPKKPNRIGDYRPGNRFSFRVPGNKPKPDTECGKVDIPKRPPDLNPNSDIGRPDGYAVLYSPEQIENYKKQYPRFEAALNLVPDGIHHAEDGSQIYSFCSKNSPTGYWQVTLIPAAGISYFLLAGEPLQILCPIPYKITQVKSNGESFIWEQLEGGRLATVDPADAIDPTLYILDNVRDLRPIRFKISVKDHPDANDELVIYTTPTSTYNNLSQVVAIASPDATPCRQVPLFTAATAPPPRYLQRGYSSPSGTYTLTWNLPSCDVEYLVETIWQVNTTGQYLDVQHFPKDATRYFTAQLNTHYRVRSVFNVHKHISHADSQRFYFTSGNSLVMGDDSYNNISFTKTQTKINVLPLGRIAPQYVDNYSVGISATKLGSRINTIPLGRKILNSVDVFGSVISFNSGKTRIQKFELGGVIIR